MKKIILSFLLLIAFFNAEAQNETDVDPTFILPNKGNQGLGGVRDLTLLADGKILASGDFVNYKTIKDYANSLVRIFPNGQHDPLFNLGLSSSTGLPQNHTAITVLPSGNILYAGKRVGFNDYYTTMVDDSGSLTGMPRFPTVRGGDPTALAVQADGKIIMAGSFISVFRPLSQAPLNYRCIVRFDQNGIIDNTFNVLYAFSTTSKVNSLAIQPDGKIILSGKFTTYKNIACSNIIRINPDGSIDETFTTGSGFTGEANEIQRMKLQPDGKILIGGKFERYRDATANGFIRLEADGSRDTSFNPATDFDGNDVNMSDIQLKNDKIFITGIFNQFNGNTTRYVYSLNSDGSINTAFDASGFQFAGKILIHPNGKIYIATHGLFRNRYILGAVALDDDGSEDTDFFYTGTGQESYIKRVVVDAEDKILIAGQISSYVKNGAITSALVRLNPDGSPDSSFLLPTNIDHENVIKSFNILPDGKYLLSGHIPTYDGVPTRHIIRLNHDGSLDNTFNFNSEMFDGYVRVYTAVQPDGKIIVGCGSGVFRLNQDGSRDTTFNPDNPGIGGGNNDIEITIQPDGKILTFLEGKIVRLNADGTIDPTFSSNIRCTKFTLLPNGKIYVYGASLNLMRLNSDGSEDTSFVVENRYYHLALFVQADQKVIAARGSTLKRYNYDGSVDSSFEASVYGTVADMTTQSDGKLLIAGTFCLYNRTTVADLLVRLHGQSVLSVQQQETITRKITAYPNPVKEKLHISLPENVAVKSTQVYDLMGKKISGIQRNGNTINVTQLAKGLYILEIITTTETRSIKFIKE